MGPWRIVGLLSLVACAHGTHRSTAHQPTGATADYTVQILDGFRGARNAFEKASIEVGARVRVVTWRARVAT